MAEVFIIGQILKAVNFCEPNLFVCWNIQAGSLWKVVEGESKGQTATDRNRIDLVSVFAHPIDLHLATRGLQGWPKFNVEVYSVNALKQYHPVGFGFAYIPSTPGYHNLSITTWKISPVTVLDSIKEKFFTGGFTIVKKDLIYSGVERYKILTISSGIVEVNLNLIFKNFRKYDIIFNRT
ncbi:CLUMA_CG004920, isoform A [Clunio marinus]|uniref:B9 domain-containing protein 2 n=1 Tax=Clunio marinus TaxID=568069 RepID=A0A1J1HXJ2_9DIPT|nr:CLUMA_CG004920, isoform A [Clunio marinus]